MKKYDVVVIGSGPGGYVSAIRAAQLGKKVAIVERDKIGGSCLNVGCIPSKILLKFGEIVEDIKKANHWGIKANDVSIDVEKLMQRKDKVMEALTMGIDSLLKKNKVTLYEGDAQVRDDLTVTIGNENIKGNDILLATGSTPFVPSIKGLDKIDYMTTDTFFNMKELPKSLCIIGGGVISVELATAMAALGTKVTIVEVAEDILLTEDATARKVVKNHLAKQKIDIFTAANITEIKRGEVLLKEKTISFNDLLVATGRRPVTKLAQDLKLKMDETGKFVTVNDRYETSKQHVYAVGDLISGPQLAHAASAEGLVAVHAMAKKQHNKVGQLDIPRCVYTFPEIASIGLSEEQAKEAGYDVQVVQSSFNGNGKAMSAGETDGFVKIISETKYQEILGAVVVGGNATELISSIVGVKYAEGTVMELAHMIWPHPTLSEAIGESANALFGQAIHM
ncbi:dihydrolipoyl dehydrogenase [Pseudogracilibacillus sp. SO30301A]|uniref:dihydrolipoyl dehydrogenase n=1 Tax=Pseudogracilibacillus sp. SO30301A TaxID=3098291 RepID=UPI00300E0521